MMSRISKGMGLFQENGGIWVNVSLWCLLFWYPKLMNFNTWKMSVVSCWLEWQWGACWHCVWCGRVCCWPHGCQNWICSALLVFPHCVLVRRDSGRCCRCRSSLTGDPDQRLSGCPTEVGQGHEQGRRQDENLQISYENSIGKFWC